MAKLDGVEIPNLVKSNDIKKGHRILMNNGWYGTMADNKKGNIRVAEIEGFHTETGSVYSHDIVKAEIDGTWRQVLHTAAQEKLRLTVSRMGF
jgi:hypothetical protein